MPSTFMESIRQDMRLRGYSIKTEKTYLYWIRFYIRFNNMRHPKDMGADEVKQFLTWLVSDRQVDCAIVYGLDRAALRRRFATGQGFVRSPRRKGSHHVWKDK